MRFWVLIIGGALLLGLATALVATVFLLRRAVSQSETAWVAVVAVNVHPATYFAAAVLASLGLAVIALAARSR